MLNGVGNESGKNKSKGLISKKKKKTLHLQHTFFVHFLDVVLHHYNVKLPSYTSYVGNVVCAHQKFYCLCPSSVFFTAAHFHFAVHYHFSFSHRQFSCFSSNEIGLLCFLSNTLALSLSSTSVKTLKLSRTWICCCFFSLKCPGGHAISRQKPPCCIWVAIPVDWVILHWYACGVDRRAYGHVVNKIPRVHTKFSYPWCSPASASLSTYIT